MQRRNAMALAGGALSSQVEDWRRRVLTLSAQIEATLDFGDEEDVGIALPLEPDLARLVDELAQWLDRPRAETLREGVRVVIAGPPNAGKSTLFNALTDSEAAIVTPMAGTTRDLLMRTVALAGVAFTFIDTAGLREAAIDPVEAIGIARAREAARGADVVLWLGAEGEGPAEAWEIAPQIDLPAHIGKSNPRHRISALTNVGMAALGADLVACASRLIPQPGDIAISAHQRNCLAEAWRALAATRDMPDPLLLAEHCRLARVAFDRLVGRTATEDMLDMLFARFCIGK